MIVASSSISKKGKFTLGPSKETCRYFLSSRVPVHDLKLL